MKNKGKGKVKNHISEFRGIRKLKTYLPTKKEDPKTVYRRSRERTKVRKEINYE